jgi:hypothetical protein
MSLITIGCIAVDLASGFEGIAVSRSELFNGNVQFAIQPQCQKDSSTLPDPFAFDAISLVYKNKGISEMAVRPQFTDINVGDEVEDIVTGVRGITTTKTTFLNGCVYFEVTAPKEKAKKNEFDVLHLTCARLKKVGKTSLKPITAAGEKPTGGPTTRAYRAT